MSHWIAISWDKNQLLLLTARTKKGKTFFEKAVRILPDLVTESGPGKQEDVIDEQKSSEQGFTPETVKTKLRHFVQQERLGKYDTVVVVGRNDVEVRSMIFPPVPNDEIPEMAKFQASKEFTDYDHTASLDFVLFDGARKDKKHILAAMLPKTKRDTIEDVVGSAGLDLQRIVLGPCESAKRFATITVQQRTGGAGKTTLLVEMGEHSATLILLYRGMPAFVRTTSFQNPVWDSLDQADKRQFENADELANWKWLTADFKRTIIAAVNDVPSEKIDEIVLCGTGERYEKLVRLLEESLAVPVSLFNVWRFENREGEIANHLPVFEEQFLPLIGALTAAMAEKPSTIDFKNPKRKAEKQSKRPLVTVVVALCLVLVFVLGGWGLYRRMALESELKSLTAQEISLKEDANKTDRLKLQHDAINDWQKNDVNWLEQLEWLSNSIPPDEDVILSSGLTLRAPVNANAVIEFTALTRGTTVAPLLEQNLRDETHTVRSPKAEPSQDQTYTQKRELTVTIIPSKEPAKTSNAASDNASTANDSPSETSAQPQPDPSQEPKTTTPASDSANDKDNAQETPSLQESESTADKDNADKDAKEDNNVKAHDDNGRDGVDQVDDDPPNSDGTEESPSENESENGNGGQQ